MAQCHWMTTRPNVAHIALPVTGRGDGGQGGQMLGLCIQFWTLFAFRTVMKSGSELVKAGLRAFFENAGEDLEKTSENLKLGKFTHSRTQIKGVSQNINYTTVALLPILTSIFEHVAQHQFGVDLLCECHCHWYSCMCTQPLRGSFGLYTEVKLRAEHRASCFFPLRLRKKKWSKEPWVK